MVKISSGIVMDLSVAVPEIEEQDRILDCLGASDHRLNIETMSVGQLRALKSGLIDDLLTGRVRVTPIMKTGCLN
jgi:type I restriction enzyme S subunit